MAAERNLERHINAVGAMTMAVSAMPRTAYNPDRKSRLNLGVGSYGSAGAVAVGLSHDFNDRISANLNVAKSMNRAGNTGFSPQPKITKINRKQDDV
jgi:autotransporter adhesin